MKKWLIVSVVILTLFSSGSAASASTWAQKSGYWAKTGGKFSFGLKHSFLSWVSMFFEANEPQYQQEWQGFCVGLGKTVVYTASGLVQLATFPVPVDFPDIGLGLHVPNKNCPDCHWDYKLPEKTGFYHESKTQKTGEKIVSPETLPVETGAQMETALQEQVSGGAPQATESGTPESVNSQREAVGPQPVTTVGRPQEGPPAPAGASTMVYGGAIQPEAVSSQEPSAVSSQETIADSQQPVVPIPGVESKPEEPTERQGTAREPPSAVATVHPGETLVVYGEGKQKSPDTDSAREAEDNGWEAADNQSSTAQMDEEIAREETEDEIALGDGSEAATPKQEPANEDIRLEEGPSTVTVPIEPVTKTSKPQKSKPQKSPYLRLASWEK
ncbi:MAG: hypothetical protein PHN49_10735 [Candidatus Omnitrophica bacterium]|nr:hypothetical protein [Candidatus Omnitrophota bacterium]MDD5672104.1 hypothetical protein [Candidatus Omnitrophota bacterium]